MPEPWWVHFLCVWKWTIFWDSVSEPCFMATASFSETLGTSQVTSPKTLEDGTQLNFLSVEQAWAFLPGSLHIFFLISLLKVKILLGSFPVSHRFCLIFWCFLWYFPTHLSSTTCTLLQVSDTSVHLGFFAYSVSSTNRTWQDFSQFSSPHLSIDPSSLLGACHFSYPFWTLSSRFLFFYRK